MGAPRFDEIEGEIQEAPVPAPTTTAAPRFDDIEGDVQEAPPPEPETSTLGALGRNLLGGYTKNWSDEAVGQLSKLDPRQHGNGAAYKMPDGSVRFMDTPEDSANVRTEEQRQLLKADAHQHPIASTIGNVIGELGSDATAAELGVPGVGSLPYQLITGALSGAGAADDSTPGGKTGGAAMGTALAGAGYGLGKYIVGPVVGRAGKLAQNAYRGSALEKFLEDSIAGPVAEKLEKFAANRAMKAAGYIQKDIKPVARRNPEQIVEKGKELLREGVVRGGRTVEDVADQAQGAVQKYGDAIGKVLKAADSTGAKFNMNRFVQRARKEILDPMMVNGKVDPALRNEASKIAALIDGYEGLGDTPFSVANQLKSNLQEKINWGNRWNDAKSDVNNELLLKMQRLLLEEVDDQLGGAFNSAGVPGGQRIRDAFKELKRRYGIHIDALDKSRQGVARDLGNQFVGAKDVILGSGLAGGGLAQAFATGDPSTALKAVGLGAAAALANKLIRQRGSSAAAVGANELAQVIQRKWLLALPAVLQSSPEALGRYGPVFAREYQLRGHDGVMALDKALTGDPQYEKEKETALERMLGAGGDQQ